MENNISILWEELSLFLEGDEDFRIIKILEDSIEIKALNIQAFHIRWIYCKILSAIMPLNSTLLLNGSYIVADNFKNDLLLFDLTINTEKLFYKGFIKITK